MVCLLVMLSGSVDAQPIKRIVFVCLEFFVAVRCAVWFLLRFCMESSLLNIYIYIRVYISFQLPAEELNILNPIASTDDCLLSQSHVNSEQNWHFLNHMKLNFVNNKRYPFYRNINVLTFNQVLYDSDILRAG
jgi:hypothetical protein